MNSNFNYWYNEIADMPELVNGFWVDLETGLPFKSIKQGKKAAVEKHPDSKLKLSALLSKAERLVKSQEYAVNKFNGLMDLALSNEVIRVAKELFGSKPTKAKLLNLITMNSDASRYVNEQEKKLNN